MYAVLDIESTGGKYNEEGITEIAIYRFDGHQIIDCFISLINPERPIQEFVTKLTGINNNMLVNAPKFYEVAKRIVEITDNATLVAHNAQFDYRILKTEFNRLGYAYNRSTLCTVTLSQELLPEAESHSLGKLVRSLGLPVTDRHRANGDALATLELFKILLTKDSKKEIITKVTKDKKNAQFSDRQINILEMLPTEIGTFYFLDKKGEIIYIQSAKNIKQAVTQIFVREGEQDRKFQKTIREVKYELTGNLLAAQIKEAEEISTIKPKWNKQILRFAAKYYIVSSSDNQEPPRLITHQEYNPNLLILARFPTLKKADNYWQELKKCFADNIEKYKNNSANNSLGLRSNLLIEKGRQPYEKCVFLFENNALIGYGYTSLDSQRFDRKILNQLIKSVPDNAYLNYIVETYLRNRKNNNRINLI